MFKETTVRSQSMSKNQPVVRAVTLLCIACILGVSSSYKVSTYSHDIQQVNNINIFDSILHILSMTHILLTSQS